MMRVNKKFQSAVLFMLILFLPVAAFAQAGDDVLPLKIKRDFGLGLGRTIQGTFSLHVEELEGLELVEFLIDDQVVSSIASAPFRYSFSTNEFLPGMHSISAVGTFIDSRVQRADPQTYEFIGAEEARGVTMKILLPIFLIVGVVMLLSGAGTMLLGRKKGSFKMGEYGMAGGAVCPRCELPFARHTLAPNLLIGKLERCPHCGKLSIVPRAGTNLLRAAEERLMEDQGRGKFSEAPTEEQTMQQMLDDSRFEE
jgi:hypothetical protein